MDDYGAPRENTPNVPAVSQLKQITTFQNERRPWLIFQANILRDNNGKHFQDFEQPEDERPVDAFGGRGPGGSAGPGGESGQMGPPGPSGIPGNPGIPG